MPTRPPADPARQLQWLVDRADITDLFHAFACAIDEKDQADAAPVRTAEGWRFASIAPTIVWNTGEMIRGGPPGGGMLLAKAMDA